MKKILFLASIALATAVSFSCNKENIEGEDNTPAGGTALFPAPAVINASSAATKTALEGTSILWEYGDAIALFGKDGKPVTYTLEEGDGTTSGTFTAGAGLPAEVTAYAVYPVTDNNLADNAVAVTVPAEQTYVAGGFPTDYPMAAVTSNGTDFTFENLATVLRLQVKGDASVKAVSVRTLGENEYIAGESKITFGDTPVLAGGSANTVTLDCGDGVQLSTDGNGTAFNFVLISGTYNGIEVTVTGTDNNILMQKSTSSEIVLNAGAITTLSPMSATPIGWNIAGSFVPGVTDDWNANWLQMSDAHGLWYFKDIEVPEGSNTFKIRNGANIWYGLNIDHQIPTRMPYGIYSDNNDNLSVAAGNYDFYLDPNGNPCNLIIMEAGIAPLVVTGTCNSWSETPLLIENEWLVAKNVTFNETEGSPMGFKIRLTEDGNWKQGRYNIGFSDNGDIVTNGVLNVVNNAGGNMQVPEAGTYDIYFDLGAMQVWVMTPGYKPGDQVPAAE